MNIFKKLLLLLKSSCRKNKKEVVEVAEDIVEHIIG